MLPGFGLEGVEIGCPGNVGGCTGGTGVLFCPVGAGPPPVLEPP